MGELCYCGTHIVVDQFAKHKETCSYCWKCPGCNAIMAKPQMSSHKSSCKAMELCWCGLYIVKSQMADHQATCATCWKCPGCNKYVPRLRKAEHCSTCK